MHRSELFDIAVMTFLFLLRWPRAALGLLLLLSSLQAQVNTSGFLNLPRSEAPGTLLSHPVANGSEPIGRTTSINYLNGWIIVGGEGPGSREGSDLEMRVYDISDPENPIRRRPSDFGFNYPNNRWYQGNVGWNAHGTAQSDSLLLPSVVRVSSFGAPVELGGENGVPELGNLPLNYSRASMAGPWNATFLWYGTRDQDIVINKARINQFGTVQFQDLAQFDHVGQYGGGDWHPIFFGDLLIMARSGGAGRDGVVVYRLQYHNFDDADRDNDAITPHFVASLDDGFQGYWPNLFSDGTGLYVIGSSTDILVGADITEAANPSSEDGSIRLAASLTIPNTTNASYPTYQDQFAFIHNRKVDMTRFLAGDANPVVLTLDEAGTGVNTSQMSLPLGNLWLTGGAVVSGLNQGMGVWVHQQAADTTPPRVSYHIPQSNRTQYPRFAPLSFLVHEHTRAGGPRNGIDFLVREVLEGDQLGNAVSGFLLHDFAGTLTFTPDVGLAADATYQVDFPSDPANDIGFRDAAGNYIEPYSFRFSTGGGINAVAPPVFDSLSADVYQPVVGQAVTVSASATGESPIEFRFNFDGAWTNWSANSSASYTYTTTGRPRVLVQARDATGNVITDSLRLLVIDSLATGPRPTQSSTMAVGDDDGTRRLWVVNPDSDTVSVLHAVTGEFIAEYIVGKDPRGIARDVNGRYWVTCHGSDEIRIFNADGSVFRTLELDYGAAPFGIATSPDGQSLFVTLYGSGHLSRYSAANPDAAPVVRNTFPTPRSIAVSADGQRVFVTRFISPELEAEIGEFAGTSADLAQTRIVRLRSSNTIDGGDRSAGVPNYLAGIAISPDGTRAAVVSKQDNVQRGAFYGVNDLTHETTVRSVISFLDLEANREIVHTRRDFDNSDSPSAVTYTPLGDTILVTLQGNNRVVGIDALSLAPSTTPDTPGSTDTRPAVITLDLATGIAPQGVLLDPASGRLYSQDFMGRSVTVRDASRFIDENRTTLPLVSTTSTVSYELLDEQVLQGKRIFYNAADPRMSAESYISCATCHIDGGSDGRVWDFTGRGEGFRRTTDLRGRSGTGNGNVHWSANFDEIQDFEHDMRGPFGGRGFIDLTAQQFALQHPSPASDKAGLSEDLDALAAYVASLSTAHVPRSPARNQDGTFTASALRGRDVFVAHNCASCHSGDSLTNSIVTPVSSPALFNVGSLSALSGSRLGDLLEGIDTPTLHGLHAARNYLHHGQADTLEEVFSYAGGTLLLASEAEHLSPREGALSVSQEEAQQGGGGFYRGAFGGTSVRLFNEPGVTPAPGVRFSNIDGGPSGGPARVSIRYAKPFSNSATTLTINGVPQTIQLERQYPDNSWQVSGWRWITVEAALNAGATNTIEVFSTEYHLHVNALLVANAVDLTTAQPHRLVRDLPADDRADLLDYLRQLDGRDDQGVPLSDRRFEQWISNFPNPLPENERGVQDDPDADGLANILEYLFGSDPTANSHQAYPEILWTNINEELRSNYHVRRNPTARGWRLIIERSQDMTDWETVGSSENGEPATGSSVEGEIPGEMPTIIISVDETSSPKRFFRVRAEMLSR